MLGFTYTVGSRHPCPLNTVGSQCHPERDGVIHLLDMVGKVSWPSLHMCENKMALQHQQSTCQNPHNGGWLPPGLAVLLITGRTVFWSGGIIMSNLWKYNRTHVSDLQRINLAYINDKEHLESYSLIRWESGRGTCDGHTRWHCSVVPGDGEFHVLFLLPRRLLFIDPGLVVSRHIAALRRRVPELIEWNIKEKF